MNSSLSSEEIDQLIKDTLEHQKKSRDTQLEFELGYYDEKPEEPKKVCFHEWVEYLGLNESFIFCKLCDVKKV